MDAGSSRPGRPIAISTSFRSPAPSPSPSPTPSSPGADGLSRRSSWSRPQEDAYMAGRTDRLRSLAPPSRARLIVEDGTMEEYDVGTREIGNSGRLNVNRPFFHQANSTTSFESIHSYGSAMDDRDQIPFASSSTSRIYPTPSLPGRTKPRKAYDEAGVARGPRNLASGVARSPTFRAVSETLRKASVRVSNMLSPGRDDGRTRIPDGDGDDDKASKNGYEMDPFQAGPPVVLDPGKPDALPPEIKVGLRGRTLCLFGPENLVRKTCSAVLNWQ